VALPSFFFAWVKRYPIMHEYSTLKYKFRCSGRRHSFSAVTERKSHTKTALLSHDYVTPNDFWCTHEARLSGAVKGPVSDPLFFSNPREKKIFFLFFFLLRIGIAVQYSQSSPIAWPPSTWTICISRDYAFSKNQTLNIKLYNVNYQYLWNALCA
jgi:hypothetical protein